MLSAVVMTAGLAFAQAPAPSLSFEEARRIARERYPAIAAARLQSRTAHRRADASGTLGDPMVGVQLWNMPINHVEGSLMPGLTPRERAINFARGPEMIPIMVMAQQTFPWPGKLGAESREQDALARREDAQAEVMQADVDRAVSYAFVESFAAARSVDTLQRTLSVLDAMVALSDARVSTNSGSPLEALNARSERESLQRDLIDTRRQTTVARSRLAVLLGLSDPSQLPPITQTMQRAKLPARDELIRAAVSQRPEVKGARALVDAALARAQRTRLAALPDVTANVSYMANFGGLGMAIDHGPAMALFGPADQVTVGVSIPLPIFAPWKQGREADAARLDHKRAEAEVDALIAVVTTEIDELIAGIDHAREHLELHEQSLIPLSTRTLEMAQASYESGRVPITEVLNAARTLRAHHLERWASHAEYARHLADLERATMLPLVHFSDDTVTP